MPAGPDAREFAANYGDDQLGVGIEALIAANYAASPVEFDAGRLRNGLVTARRRCLKAATPTARNSLPALNP
jgi:hypothetical protein